MIKSFRLKRFKAFVDSGDIPLAPLTCLVGRNSSGKSSLVQALLLLRQSISDEGVSSPFPQLLVNGPSFEGGSFEDIVFKHKMSSELGFSFRSQFEPISEKDRARNRPRPSSEPIVPLRLPAQGMFAPYYQRAFLLRRYGHLPSHPTDIHVSLFFSREAPFGPGLARIEIGVADIGSATFLRTSGKRREQHWRVYTNDLPRQSITLTFPMGRFLPSLYIRQKGYGSAPARARKKLREFLSCAEFAVADIMSFLGSIRIVGPFRTPPERRYVFTGFRAADVGPSGKQAVDLLIMEGLLSAPDARPLRKAVASWLKQLGLARNFDIRRISKKSNLFELILSRAGVASKANFADVGFGISQVLPVLVQGLLTPRGGTYVVQQPELHLHPDAQAGLADFFLFLAKNGVRTIVETHSEYILLRVRRRLAEGHTQAVGSDTSQKVVLTKSDVSILFVKEQPTGNRFEQLEIGDSFQFENMPRDFMNQAVQDRLHLLHALGAK